MALTDVLRQRAARRGGTAQVDCGELGVLTVEALPPADCARLASDSRSLLYAACRELQKAGETLRSEGKIFRPDEITVYLSDEEAGTAARTILELSGESVGINGNKTGTEREHPEIRPQSVQDLGGTNSEIRPQSVQTLPESSEAAGALWAADEEIRLSSVQGSESPAQENGQDSCEFSAAENQFADEIGGEKKSQILGEMSSRTAQILVSEKGEAHERIISMAEAAADLHEIESEVQRQGRGHLHETKSELRGSGLPDLHETTSDFGGRRKILLHETESEPAREMHETESEFSGAMHEIKSELKKGLHEIKSEVREMLHEIESELPEQAAQRLAKALLRAGQVQ